MEHIALEGFQSVIRGPIIKLNLVNCNSISDVMQIVKNDKKIFLSRGDSSGTHEMELSLWKSMDLDIRSFGKWYKSVGQGMGGLLNMANELNAYTISDKGTWFAFMNKQNLKIICENKPSLKNQYGIIAVNPNKHANVNYEWANKYISWLLSKKGKNLINNFRKFDQQLFYFNYK